MYSNKVTLYICSRTCMLHQLEINLKLVFISRQLHFSVITRADMLSSFAFNKQNTFKDISKALHSSANISALLIKFNHLCCIKS